MRYDRVHEEDPMAQKKGITVRFSEDLEEMLRKRAEAERTSFGRVV